MRTGTSRIARQYGDLYKAITDDIYVFARACGFEPTHQQRELLDAVQLGVDGDAIRRIAVRSGQGPGKTTTSGVVGLFLMLRDPFSKLLLTAPTMRQCKDVWLAEVKRTLRRTDPAVRKFFNTTETSVGVLGHKATQWGALLLTASRPEALQGHHAENMHVIVEEASGVERQFIEQFKGTLSNPDAFFIQIGNPNTRDCAFFDCFNTQADRWLTFHWNAEETPKSRWFDPARNAELEDEYGRNSDVYRVRVLGEFPHADPNCIMSSDDVLACMEEGRIVEMSRLNPGVKQIGGDVARYGGDESVLIRRSGNAVVEKFWQARIPTTTFLDKAYRMQHDAGWRTDDTVYVVDATGMGQGVIDQMQRAGRRVVEFHNHGASTEGQKYANKIAEAWFNFARLIGKKQCAIPRDNVLMQQLSSRQYLTDSKGRIVVEKKDDYIKRGYDSPDRAEGIIMAFWNNAIADAQLATSRRERMVRGVGAV